MTNLTVVSTEPDLPDIAVRPDPGADTFGVYIDGNPVASGMTEGEACGRAADEAEKIVAAIMPRVEYVGAVTCPQPGGEPECVAEVFATDERVLLHQSQPFPRYTPAEARQIADLLVAGAQTCKRGV